MKVSTAATNGSQFFLKKSIPKAVVTIASPRAVGSGRGEANGGQIWSFFNILSHNTGTIAADESVDLRYKWITKIKKSIPNAMVTIALPRAVGFGRGEASGGQIRRSSRLCAEEGGGAPDPATSSLGFFSLSSHTTGTIAADESFDHHYYKWITNFFLKSTGTSWSPLLRRVPLDLVVERQTMAKFGGARACASRREEGHRI
jgi:hypothetical protein